VIGIMIGYAVVRWKAKPKTHLVAEYWVYLGSSTVPLQDDIMSQLVKNNPHAGFTTREALFFSDVRVRINSVLRAKNVAAFRPDLFNGGALTPAQITQLADSPVFVRIKFASEESVRDRRYLTFLMHAAAAYAALGDGVLVYDFVLAKPYSIEEFLTLMQAHKDVSDPSIQTEVRWREEGDILSAESAGMVKIGLPDLRAQDVAPDTRILTESLLQAAIRTLWLQPSLPPEIEVEEYGDKFLFRFEPARNGFAAARVTRIQAR
jgi:hypothetical protein